MKKLATCVMHKYFRCQLEIHLRTAGIANVFHRESGNTDSLRFDYKQLMLDSACR